jgi:hypothetical protein
MLTSWQRQTRKKHELAQEYVKILSSDSSFEKTIYSLVKIGLVVNFKPSGDLVALMGRASLNSEESAEEPRRNRSEGFRPRREVDQVERDAASDYLGSHIHEADFDFD